MATVSAPDILLSVDVTGFLVALETRIQSALPLGWGEVQCRIRQGRLGVGWWRAIADPLPPGDWLTVMTQAIQTALWETELPESLALEKGNLPIQIYWQYRGQPHPAAAWLWHWQPGNSLSALFDQPGNQSSNQSTWGQLRSSQSDQGDAGDGHCKGAGNSEGLEHLEAATGGRPSVSASPATGASTPPQIGAAKHPSTLLPVIETSTPPQAGAASSGKTLTSNPPVVPAAPVGAALSAVTALTSVGPAADQPWLQPSHSPSPSTTTAVPSVSPQTSPWRAWWPWGLLVTLGLGIGGISYGLSRPCVIGACSRQATAQSLSQSAIAQLQPQATGSEVLTAYEDLRQAVQLLADVPAWSPHYAAVQADLNRYQPYLKDLEWIIAAQSLGLKAAEASRFPPHSVSHWRQVYSDWQRAIAALDRVPETSPLSALRHTKRLDYLKNYQAIGARMAAERAAEMNLNQALQLAQAATTQAVEAHDLLTWDAVRQDWQGAVDALARIPRGTLAHREARSLLTPYRENLAAARTQVIQQQAGEFAHRRAIAAETAARQAETQNQWTQAVSQWRQAIAALDQIPDNTAHSPGVAERAKGYHSALAIAQENLRRAVLLQQALEVISPLCPEQGDRCRAVILNQRLVLQLQPPYDRALTQAITSPVTGTPVPLSPSSRIFLQTLANTLNRLPSPTPIQDAAGQPIGEYHPSHGGYRR